MSRNKTSLQTILILGIVAFICGCVYLPYPVHNLTEGRGEITEESIDVLEIGETTRKDVLLQFGEPSWSSANERVFEYEWAVEKGEIYFLGATSRVYSWFYVSLTFDESGKLTDKQRCENCGSSLIAKNNPVEDEFSPLFEVPQGKAAVFVYRVDNPFLASGVPLPIEINGGYMTRLPLTPPTYSYMVIEPGELQIGFPRKLIAPIKDEKVERITITINVKDGEILYVEFRPIVSLSKENSMEYEITNKSRAEAGVLRFRNKQRVKFRSIPY